MIDILPLKEEHLPAAAEIFVQHYAQQRQVVPSLPDYMTNPAVVSEKLSALCQRGIAMAAVEDGVLLAYMGSWMVNDLRNTGRKGAYCPEWGHGALQSTQASVFASLYHKAVALWAEEGCQLFATSLLAVDEAAREFWFWNSYGLSVIDAIRPIQPLDFPCPPGFSIRKAEIEDAALIAELDIQHRQYYTRPPLWMVERTTTDESAFHSLLSEPNSSVWLACDDQQAVGFLRFEPRSDGAADIVQSPETITIIGAYLQPACRGTGLGSAILDAALQHYAELGFQHCAVNFESFNPPANHFWQKHFQPVVYSVIRYPEALIAKS